MKKIGQHGFKPTKPNTCVAAAIVNYASMYSDSSHIVDREMLYQRYLDSPFRYKDNGTDIRLTAAQVEWVTKGVYSAALLVPENIHFDLKIERNILAKLRDLYNESTHRALRDFEDGKTCRQLSIESLQNWGDKPYSPEDRAYIVITQKLCGDVLPKYVDRNIAHAVCVQRTPRLRGQILQEDDGWLYELESTDSINAIAALEITQQKPLDEICRERHSY